MSSSPQRFTSSGQSWRFHSLSKARQMSYVARHWRKIRQNTTLFIMALPAMVLLLLFSYVPMLGLVLAFKDFKTFQGIWGSAWVGLQNFQFLYQTAEARQATFNTLFLNALFIITMLIGSVGLALLLNEVRDRRPGLANLYQSVMFFPYFLSYVLISYFIFALLSSDNGLLNHLLVSLHIT